MVVLLYLHPKASHQWYATLTAPTWKFQRITELNLFFIYKYIFFHIFSLLLDNEAFPSLVDFFHILHKQRKGSFIAESKQEATANSFMLRLSTHICWLYLLADFLRIACLSIYFRLVFQFSFSFSHSSSKLFHFMFKCMMWNYVIMSSLLEGGNFIPVFWLVLRFEEMFTRVTRKKNPWKIRWTNV